jgi:alanine racemase
MIILDDLITATDAEALVSAPRRTLERFAHDSRLVRPGDCFVAVRGIHGDGHDFLEDAIERGATALLCARDRVEHDAHETSHIRQRAERAGVALLVVRDTREALRRYASYILRAWKPTVIAVTGATGKSTTKEAIAEALQTQAPTFRSWRNYNDALGLPLSLGALEPTHRFAVLELGADHPGEIADLCAMVGPRVGVVTSVSATHLQYFGSLERYAEELAALPAALPPDGTAVLNADDPMARAMAARVTARVVFYGRETPRRRRSDHENPDLIPLPIGEDGRLSLAMEDRSQGAESARVVEFPHLCADYWAGAIFAALSVSGLFQIHRDVALDALRELEPLPGRMRRLGGRDGITLLDDSHNSTPASASAGLASLARLGSAVSAPRIAVLADMLRLGGVEERAHRELGLLAAEHADYLVTCGLLGEIIAASAHSRMPAERIAVTHTQEDAAQAALQFARDAAERMTSLRGAPIVYIKGSEEMRMEQVAALMLAPHLRPEDVLDRQTQAWRRVVVMRPDRPTWLEVDLSAIARNTQLVKELVGPEAQVLVSLKADAYGHGALRVARTALHNGASWLGVATVSEAAPLRDAGVRAPILVFGYAPPWQARDVAQLDLRATVYSLDTAGALSRAALDLGREVRVHVKVDTGMARLGLRWEDIPLIVAFVEALRQMPGLVVEGVFTHFATADSADQTYALRQLERFESVLAALDERGLRPPLVHAANSAATLALPQARFDMVRPGVAIYGLAPSAEVRLPGEFRPALAFKTQVAQVKDVPASEGISYGATYVTTRTTTVAVLPVGYADGFRRAPANWGEVLVRGRRAPLLGRVCMDQSMVDVSDIPGVRQGDEVVLIGRQGADELTAEEVATRLGTINYEVVAELLARVPRMS